MLTVKKHHLYNHGSNLRVHSMLLSIILWEANGVIGGIYIETINAPKYSEVPSSIPVPVYFTENSWRLSNHWLSLIDTNRLL